MTRIINHYDQIDNALLHNLVIRHSEGPLCIVCWHDDYDLLISKHLNLLM